MEPLGAKLFSPYPLAVEFLELRPHVVAPLGKILNLFVAAVKLAFVKFYQRFGRRHPKVLVFLSLSATTILIVGILNNPIFQNSVAILAIVNRLKN